MKYDKASEFSLKLRQAGSRLLAEQPSGRYADLGQIMRAVLTVFAFFAAYAALLSSSGGWVQLGLAILCGFLAYMIVASLCHDASHGSLSRRRWVNRGILFAGFSLVGVSGALWGHRHVHVHHMFPNVEGNEIDADGSILVRLSPHVEWRFWHRFQPIYAPLLYLIVLPHLAWYLDFVFLAKARKEYPESFATPLATIEFAATKLIHIALALVIPYLVLDVSVWALLLGYWLAAGSASILFVMINIGTHICEEAEFISPDADGHIDHDWATHQAMTSVDWSPTSPLAVALTGGANAHAAHHLFPNAAHCHNARLSALVSTYADHFERPHHVVSFAGMLSSHWRHLVRLSHREAT